jgi:cytochrome c biogenesis protein CcdA
MNDLWAPLLPFLLADMVNPVLFAFMVYAAGKDRPVANSVSMLLGHTAAYFSVGILLAMGLEQVMERLANPRRIDYFIQLVIGLSLLWVAVGSRDNTGKRPDESSLSLTPVKSFGLGATINFIGIPFAVPYFAALGQILKADVPAFEVLLILAGYNLAYAVPFAAVPLMVCIFGRRSRPLLEQINSILERISDFLMPVLLGLIGLALTIDAGFYLATGEGIF